MQKPVTRRAILRAGALAVGAYGVGCEAPLSIPGPFAHGIASGDPSARGARLWTRVAGASGDVEVSARVALDPELHDVVAVAPAVARAEDGHCVSVEVEGLEPDTLYFYAFEDTAGGRSFTGRTRTLPEADPARIRLAFTCCASLGHGYLHTYQRIADREDVDVVVHLGDYIYEYGDGGYGTLRGYDPPHATLSLEDYRRRYAYYRSEPELAALHARHPMIVTWDDHELANNAWPGGAAGHDPVLEGPWERRRDAAARAHREWLPWRDDGVGLFRAFRFGELAELFVLDTRGRRDAPPVDLDEAGAPGRSILGPAQRDAFLAALRASTARWKLVAGSVQLSPHAEFWNLDAWDGYADERRRILEVIEGESIDGVVFVCGDGHKSFADDVPRDLATYEPSTGLGSVAVELMTPAASSPNLFGSEARAFEARVRAASPHTRFVDAESRGYWVVDLDPSRAAMELYFVAGVEDPAGGEERLAARFELRAGERWLRG